VLQPVPALLTATNRHRRKLQPMRLRPNIRNAFIPGLLYSQTVIAGPILTSGPTVEDFVRMCALPTPTFVLISVQMKNE
jgi:hypothetical protein